jgi:hypothetical protein
MCRDVSYFRFPLPVLVSSCILRWHQIPFCCGVGGFCVISGDNLTCIGLGLLPVLATSAGKQSFPPYNVSSSYSVKAMLSARYYQFVQGWCSLEGEAIRSFSSIRPNIHLEFGGMMDYLLTYLQVTYRIR